ncbi:MAG: hypothetical protein ACK5F5_11845 [Gammaproteobacteria bacterium]
MHDDALGKPPMDGAAEVSSSTVRGSAAVAGLPLEDEAVAARIAAGAGAAVAAVREALSRVDDPDALFEREPAEYLALLEALAEPTKDPR